jgi:hypothetical protein
MKLIALALCLASGTTFAADDAYVHGSDHCYYMSTPKGWRLDSLAGMSAGVPIVAYPIGSSWRDSSTVFYTRPAEKVSTTKTPSEVIQAQVQKVLEKFRIAKTGDKTQATFVKVIENKSGAKGELWEFSGDQWGNTELAAYFPAKNTLNFFVMSSRTKEEFDRHTSAFIELAASYREGDDCVPCSTRTDQLACTSKTIDTN